MVVTFTTVSIREHDRCIGDHPCCTGPPLSLDWGHGETCTMSLKDYEKKQEQHRVRSSIHSVASSGSGGGQSYYYGCDRSGKRASRVSASKREKILLDRFKCDETELGAALAEIARVKKQRDQTLGQLKASNNLFGSMNFAVRGLLSNGLSQGAELAKSTGNLFKTQRQLTPPSA